MRNAKQGEVYLSFSEVYNRYNLGVSELWYAQKTGRIGLYSFENAKHCYYSEREIQKYVKNKRKSECGVRLCTE